MGTIYVYIMNRKFKSLEIKNEVKNNMTTIGNLFNVKAKTIYETSVKTITKRKSDVIPEDEEDK